MDVILRFYHLTPTATPFKHMNFNRNGNKRSFIESKNKGIAVMKYQEWLDVIPINPSIPWPIIINGAFQHLRRWL
jgi:hypothetical protein